MDSKPGCVTVFFLWILAVIAVIGWAGIRTDATPEPSPTSLMPPVRVDDAEWAEFRTWRRLGGLCADGWRSPSIGRQGACSHHGGVSGGVLYVDPRGQRHVCPSDAVMVLIGRPACDP